VPLADADGPWDTHVRRAVVLFGVWAAFLDGALLSGFVTLRVGERALAFPLCLLVILTVLAPARGIDANSVV
jgi:uncharacterized membrane protein YoaK (UPF0700 family)